MRALGPRASGPQFGVGGRLRAGRPRSQVDSVPNDILGWHSRGYLPHFDRRENAQALTYRLVDSLPKRVLRQMKEMSRTEADYRQ